MRWTGSDPIHLAPKGGASEIPRDGPGVQASAAAKILRGDHHGWTFPSHHLNISGHRRRNQPQLLTEPRDPSRI